jgi:hypothetical protein
MLEEVETKLLIVQRPKDEQLGLSVDKDMGSDAFVAQLKHNGGAKLNSYGAMSEQGKHSMNHSR